MSTPEPVPGETDQAFSDRMRALEDARVATYMTHHFQGRVPHLEALAPPAEGLPWAPSPPQRPHTVTVATEPIKVATSRPSAPTTPPAPPDVQGRAMPTPQEVDANEQRAVDAYVARHFGGRGAR